jgi:hypothetical protein
MATLTRSVKAVIVEIHSSDDESRVRFVYLPYDANSGSLLQT